MSEMAAAPETPRAVRFGRKAGAASRPQQAQSGGAVYGLGMIGALVYFAGNAEGGMDYVLAFGKAMVWPAILVYRALKVLGA